VIGDNGIAVPLVVPKHGWCNGVAPTAAINTAPKDDSTIATGNGSTGVGA